MNKIRKIKILSIYRGKLDENRGTPIRVRSILECLVKYRDVSLVVASWDNSIKFAEHFHLTNKHFDDLKKLYNYIKQNNIEVIIGHSMSSYYYLLPLKFITKADIVLEMHGFLEEESRMYGGISMFRYFMDKIIFGIFYSLCDLITASSQTAVDILSKYNKNTLVLYGGANLSVFNPEVKSGGYINKVEGDIIIGYAGNARIWQGLDFLLDACKDIIKGSPCFKLAILTSEKKKHTSDRNIIYVNSVEHSEVPKFLSDCDILVIPRLENTVNKISFPSKLIEYMAMGKPVIASRTSDIHRVIKDGFDGVLYKPGDEDEFREGIFRLVDAEERRRIGQNAYNTVKEKFTWEQQVSVLINELRERYRPE